MGDFSSFLRLVNLAAAGVGASISLPLLYRAGLRVYDDLYERRRKIRHDRLTLDRIRDQNRLNDQKLVYPDERGRWPMVRDTQGNWLEVNTMRQFTVQTVRQTWPQLERLDWAIRTLLAMQGVPAAAARQVAMPEIAETAGHWPEVVTLENLLQRSGNKPGLHRLVLGVSLDAGQERIVYGDMQEMVHVLVSGASGFGKSTFVEALAKQLVLGGDCDLAFVDYGVNTFGALADYGVYPIADTPAAAVALFKALIIELQRRRELFQEYPQVKDLDKFNEITGSNLRPLVCFVDESAGLFAHEGTKGPATELAQMGRKGGLGLVLAGTDFKAGTLPTEASGNCGARFALHLRPSLSQSLLGSRAASVLCDKGRALAELPGLPGLVELQCPIVRRWDDLPSKRPQIELAPEPVQPATDGLGELSRDEVLDLVAQGETPSAISYAAFGYSNGNTVRRVQEWISNHDDDDSDDSPDGSYDGLDGESESSSCQGGIDG